MSTYAKNTVETSEPVWMIFIWFTPSLVLLSPANGCKDHSRDCGPEAHRSGYAPIIDLSFIIRKTVISMFAELHFNCMPSQEKDSHVPVVGAPRMFRIPRH